MSGRDMINSLPNRLIAVALLWLPLACATSQRAYFPDVAAEQFKLDIDADWTQVGSGRPLPIRHRLVNSSALSVCIGGSQVFRLDGRRIQTKTLLDALCDSPLKVVPPGGAIEWTIEWLSTVKCEMESEVPTWLAKNFPFRICGNLVELRSEIAVYRMYAGSPERPSNEIVSAPQQFRLSASEP